MPAGNLPAFNHSLLIANVKNHRLPVSGPLSASHPCLLSPGVATYTDKLFKFRNNRWEDILSDDVNVARGVASLFAGRSVACVDRTVSAGIQEGLGGSREPKAVPPILVAPNVAHTVEAKY